MLLPRLRPPRTNATDTQYSGPSPAIATASMSAPLMRVTAWLAWFLMTLHRALDQAHGTLDTVLAKARFWQRWAMTPMNERQVKLLNRLLDGFEGKLTSSKWAAIAKCSADTALRDINDLVGRGVLRRMEGGGRSTAYELG